MRGVTGRFIGIMMLGLMLAACGNQPQTVGELPTVAALPTLTATLPVTATATVTLTVTPTDTVTPTATAMVSDTPTVTPSATITDTPTPTATNTPLPSDTPYPTADNEGLMALVQLAAKATILPPNLLPAVVPTVPGAVVGGPTAPPALIPTCSTPPSGGFAAVYNSDPTLAVQMGCPLGLISFASASQTYQAGEMIWMAGPPQAIYALFSTGRFTRYDDTFNASVDPASGGETAPAGLMVPVRGFGKVWRTFAEVHALGWATSDELGGQSTAQIFERGQMVYLPQRGMIVVLITDNGGLNGGWRMAVGSY